MAIGELIKNLRVRNKMTQEELAKKADVSREYISQTELNKIKKPSAQYLSQIAKALGISRETLYKEAGVVETSEEEQKESYEELLERARLAAPLRVPVYSKFTVHAGVEHRTPTEYFYLPRGATAGENIEAYIIHGHCLSPKVEEGDIVVVDRDVQVEPGRLIMCLIDDEICVGQYQKRGEENWLGNNEEDRRIQNCQYCRVIIGIYKRP